MKLPGRIIASDAWLLFRRYAQFCIVGGSGVVVDMGIIWFASRSRAASLEPDSEQSHRG